MARGLEGAGMRDVLPLAKARVPVVKCIAPETGTKVSDAASASLCLWIFPASMADQHGARQSHRPDAGCSVHSADLCLQVDVTLNNTLAIINTKLLADYCAIDGRLTQLAFIVKHWAKRRQVRCRVLPCPTWPQHALTAGQTLLHGAGFRTSPQHVNVSVTVQ